MKTSWAFREDFSRAFKFYVLLAPDRKTSEIKFSQDSTEERDTSLQLRKSDLLLIFEHRVTFVIMSRSRLSRYRLQNRRCYARELTKRPVLARCLPFTAQRSTCTRQSEGAVVGIRRMGNAVSYAAAATCR